MRLLAAVVGVFVILIVLLEVFEAIVLPRTVTRRVRLTRLFYRVTWRCWVGLSRVPIWGQTREAVLGAYGPLSLLVLLGFWAACLITAFALLQWGVGSRVISASVRTGLPAHFYMSGATFYTLGYGDVVPGGWLARIIAVVEAGVGFGFLAIVIGYLPVIYQAFSRREVGISLLDSRAGSPPTAAELVRRYAEAAQMDSLAAFLQELERWSAELLESHLSYPVLAYYRSQHDRASWLSAITALLDTCALLRLGLEGELAWKSGLLWQVQHTFAMARHTVIDLALVLYTPPAPPVSDRLPPEMLAEIRGLLAGFGVRFQDGPESDARLHAIRREYEPYVNALAQRLLLTLPPWLPSEGRDNWQTSAWDHHNHF